MLALSGSRFAGGVSPLQGGDYVSHKTRLSLPLVRGRRERSERGGRSRRLFVQSLQSPRQMPVFNPMRLVGCCP